jgi:hypothetical protein
MDAQWGDILFSMDRLHYVGAPANIGTTAAPYGGSHRLYSSTGHIDGLGQAGYDAAMNLAFGVLPENLAPTF